MRRMSVVLAAGVVAILICSAAFGARHWVGTTGDWSDTDNWSTVHLGAGGGISGTYDNAPSDLYVLETADGKGTFEVDYSFYQVYLKNYVVIPPQGTVISIR